MAETSKCTDLWYDFGPTIHICNNRSLFNFYENMGNHNASTVVEKVTIKLEFISGKKIILATVLFVLEITKNLVFASLMCNKGVKSVLDSNSLILSKRGMFIGKGYACNDMFKLCI